MKTPGRLDTQLNGGLPDGRCNRRQLLQAIAIMSNISSFSEGWLRKFVESETNATSSGSEIQAAVNGKVVPIADGLGSNDAFDPGSTTTPVQDGIDKVSNAGGGLVLLPHGTIQDTGPIRPNTAVRVIGMGAFETFIEITGAGNDGILYDQAAGWSGVEHCTVRGNGITGNNGRAFRVTSGADANNCKIGPVRFEDWNGEVIMCHDPDATGATMYQSRFPHVEISNCDAGGTAKGLIDWQQATPTNQWGVLAAYPASDNSGADSRVFHAGAGDHNIGSINVGGSAERALANILGMVTVKQINYEANSQVAASSPSVCYLDNDRMARVEQVNLRGGTVDQIYQIDGTPQYVYVGFYRNSGGTINNAAAVNLMSEPGGPCHFEGPTGDAANNTGVALAEPNTLYCADGPLA